MQTTEEKLTLLQQQYNELFEDFKEAQDTLADLRCPPAMVEYTLDPEKVNLADLAIGKAKYSFPIQPVHMDFWRAAKGVTMHLTKFYVGEKIAGVGEIQLISIIVHKDEISIVYSLGDKHHSEATLIALADEASKKEAK